MVMPAIARRRWTAADVRALMDERRPWPRYELLDGELLVTNAPTAAHQIAVASLLVLLRACCERGQIGEALASPADIVLAPESITQPDLFVVPGACIPANEPFAWQHVTQLLLAVEVLSPSTMRDDRIRKRDFYLAHGVAEYWIVDLDARVVERWVPEQDRPDIDREELRWHPAGTGTPFVLDVERYFADNQALRRPV